MPNNRETEKERVPILVVADAANSTGFSRVSGSILKRLKHEYEVNQLGISYWGDPHELDWKVYVARLGGDPHGVNRLPQIIELVKPRLILLINDVPRPRRQRDRPARAAFPLSPVN